MHYTIDLVGRRVFASEDAAPSEDAKKTADAAQSAAEFTSEEIPQVPPPLHNRIIFEGREG